MTASHLRIALAAALLLGLGVVLNVLSSQRRDSGLRVADGMAPKPASLDQTVATTKVSRAANAARILGSVRRELEGRGYLAVAGTGPIDAATKAAILAFEFDHNLALTAAPTEQVLKALIFTHSAAAGQRQSIPETDTARAFIEEVQRALAHLGYGQADITAKLDAQTRQAIRKFERARGLQVSGRVSAPLIESLGPVFDVTKVGIAGTRPRATIPNAG